MGDQPRNADMVGRTPQNEITTGSTVQRSGQTSDIVTNTSSKEGSETSSRSDHEDTVNAV